ncbi:hypothetical protein [Nonomuraea sp. JJY05]|uniref:hypothetical protein n=1 Tax=Nonomuraea sp. JJY05 TaxID=3350255 RepID=UPI00373EBA76
MTVPWSAAGPAGAVGDSWSYRDLEFAPLPSSCRGLLAELRASADPPPPGGYAPGQVGSPLKVAEELFGCLFRAALARGEHEHGWFVWQDLDNELAVHAEECRVAVLEGLILVGLRTFCDQIPRTGSADVELVVPFAVGTPQRPAGLVAVAETAARGPSLLVGIWGETAVAASWQALVAVWRYVAALAGEDQNCRPLLPGAVYASPGMLIVVPQAIHAIDREVGA